MSQSQDKIWSNTDYPHQCLIDEIRTKAFKEAINKVVKQGDIVIDIGSGSGILALFAADAGASKVYAVELDPLLSHYLQDTIDANGYHDIIEVVSQDAMDANLPPNVDVVIAEIIETGLMDEMQVPVMNALISKKIIGPKTHLIPEQYKTFIELVHVSNDFYGHKIKAPMHMWPYYKSTSENWWQVNIVPLSAKLKLNHIHFRDINEVIVNKLLNLNFIRDDLKANAVRLSGELTLTEGIVLNDTNAMNGPKIIYFKEGEEISSVTTQINVSYEISGGMRLFKINRL